MIDFLGLDWDPNCLQIFTSTMGLFELHRRQVRQPIYTRSLERWRDYEDFSHLSFERFQKQVRVSSGDSVEECRWLYF